MKRLKAAAPWVLSALILGWVGYSADVDQVREALQGANWPVYAGILVVWAVVNLFVEAWFFHRAFRWLADVGTYGEMLRLRGAAYMLTLISSVVGFGGMIVYMKRVHGTPLRRGVGIMLVEAFSEIGSMGLLAMVGVLMAPVPGTEGIAEVGGGLFLFWAVCVALSLVTRRFDLPRTVLSLFEEVSVRQYLSLLGIKTVQNLWWGAWVAVTLPLFGVDAPKAVGMGLSQIAHLVRSLPISAFGIGVDQLAFPTLFAPWESQPGQALAFSVVFTAAVLVARATLGLVFLRPVLRQLRS